MRRFPPIIRRFDASLEALERVVRGAAARKGTVILGVADGSGHGRRFTLAALNPFLEFKAGGDLVEVVRWPGGNPPSARQMRCNPWTLLKSLLETFSVPDAEAIPQIPIGGCVGYLGYGLAAWAEPRLRRIWRPSDIGLSDCYLFFYDNLAVFDHRAGCIWVASTGLTEDGNVDVDLARERIVEWERRIDAATIGGVESGLDLSRRWEGSCGVSGERIPVRSSMLCDEFTLAVVKAREYMRSGDIYQVNLSHRLEVECRVDPWDLYHALCKASEPAFGGYCNFGDFQVVSASPELFLRMVGDEIVTRPIKGTRPRGATEDQDLRMLRELESSEKERAELLMITDLMRNDLGRVCKFGSVRVPELFKVEAHPYVFHQVSTVRGELCAGVRHLDAVEACFPGGSVTGAPKLRAMEIIGELEPVPRGPYTGAFGVIGFSRSTHLSMVIRTAICRGDRIYFNVGAGVVIDSDPMAEYEETLAKAASFFKALKMLSVSNLVLA